MTDLEIQEYIQAQIALLFKTVRIPELQENTDALSTSDQIPVWNAASNRTRKESLGDLATFFALGGNSTTIPPNAADKGEYTFDTTQSQINAGGDDVTIHLSEFAGKNYTLRIDGRDFLDAEYSVLQSGGFTINIPNYVLVPGQRVTLGFAEKLTSAPGSSSSGGFIGGVVSVGVSTTLTSNDINKVIQLRHETVPIILTLPDLSGLPDNSFFIIETTINNGKQHSIVPQAGQNIYLNDTSTAAAYIGIGESVFIYRHTDGWYVLDAGFQEIYKAVGKPFASFNDTLDLNELHLNGQIVNRADYPRLWEKVQTFGTALVSDANWSLTSALTASGVSISSPNRGKFSTGDGSTTFRVPDFRGSTVRGLLTGTDNERTQNQPGNFQRSMVESHTHGLPIEGGGATNRQSLVHNANNDESVSFTDLTASYGGAETRMDNIGIYWKIKC